MTRKELLDQKLPKDVVMKRIQGGAEVSYVGGWTVIENANRIFGYEGYSWKLEKLQQVEFTDDIVHPKTGKKGWRIAYIATGTAFIDKEYDESIGKQEQQVFTDVGFGNATSYQSIGDAVESAVKEAATDCMKRCMRFKGNQFGLALYDKQQRNVGSSLPNQIREYAATLPDDKLEATKNAIETYCKSCKAGGLEQLTYEQCNELFEMIQQLNGEGANEYKDKKKK